MLCGRTAILHPVICCSSLTSAAASTSTCAAELHRPDCVSQPLSKGVLAASPHGPDMLLQLQRKQPMCAHPHRRPQRHASYLCARTATAAPVPVNAGHPAVTHLGTLYVQTSYLHASCRSPALS